MEKGQLIKDNINFLNEYIPKLINAIEREVENLIANNETEAFRLLPNIFEGMEWTVRAINSIQELGFIEGIDLDNINSILEELSQAFQRKDYVLISDLFQYEIIEILLDWNEKVSLIKGEYN